MPDLPPDPQPATDAAALGAGDVEQGTSPQSLSSAGQIAADIRTWLDEHDAHQLRYWMKRDSFSVYCRTCEEVPPD